MSVKERRSYPMVMEQIVRGDTRSSSPAASEPRGETQPPSQRRTPSQGESEPKQDAGAAQRYIHLQTMLKALLTRVGDLIPLRYLVLDGTLDTILRLTQQCGVSLISKLRANTALYFPSTEPYAGRGRPRIYGQRFKPQQMDTK